MRSLTVWYQRVHKTASVYTKTRHTHLLKMVEGKKSRFAGVFNWLSRRELTFIHVRQTIISPCSSSTSTPHLSASTPHKNTIITPCRRRWHQ